MAPIPSPASAGSDGAAALGADFDPFTPAVRRLLPILRTIAREGGIGVLFVEQHVQFALDLADRAYLMNRGRIALSGTGAELRTRKDLVQASYLGE